MRLPLRSRRPRRLGDLGRFRFFWGITFLVWLVFFGRLYELQVAERATYAREAERTQSALHVTPAVRGEIFYSTGRPFALNEKVFTIYAVTRDMDAEQRTHAAVLLSPLVGSSKETIQGLFDASPASRYVPIASGIALDTETRIRSLGLAGIGSFVELRRFYPDGKRIGPVSGFLGWEGSASTGSDRKVGRYGVEEYNEDVLAGTPGKAESDRDAQGHWIPIGENVIQESVRGTDLTLTIDDAIESVACTKLEEAAKRVGSERGSLIILDPNNGAILALCSLPSYDPNDYKSVAKPSDFRDDAVSNSYEPGSVFKIMTMALGIDAGVVTPETTYVDTGSVKIGPDIIRNAKDRTYGKQTMVGVLDSSINTGAVFVARKLGLQRFRDGVNAFGFGRTTGVELAGEALGNIASLARNREIYMATASFGQGISVTPMQLATAFGAVANGGNLIRPTMIQERVLSNGQHVHLEPTVIRRVFSERAASLVRGMLVSVVREGHAKHAAVPGYLIGGKTGTAQVARKDGLGYSDETIHTFIGMGPMQSPRFVIVAKLDNPKTVQFAESSVTPLAGEIASYLMEYWKIPPTE